MPVMNGYEATKAVRSMEDRKLAGIPIFTKTAWAIMNITAVLILIGMILN